MYVIEHALLNLGKNKGRNILLGIIMFAVIASAFIGMAIFNTSTVIIDNARVEFDSMVRIRPQSRQMGSNGNSTTSTVTTEDLYFFAESEYLSGATIVPNEISMRSRNNETIFYLKSPDMLADFVNEIRGKGLPSDWTVYKDEAAYYRMLKPIENLKDVSLTFLIIVLVFGAAIMILLSIIAIRERKYEIGVLRAMGLKKKKVALSLWVETIAVTCACFVAGMFAGTALANPVSNALWTGDGQISIALDAMTILQILGVSILLASIAGAVSVSRITKYEPIKILMERN
jgi:putative ABC transport system permease protein